jgi:sigma-B regulation protein RsbU (phosphoserine phosphatase)
MSDREQREMERLSNAVSELSSLNEISSAINSSMAVEKISAIIVDKCIKHTNAAQGVIFLLEEKLEPEGPEQFKTFVRKMYDSRDDIPFHMHMSLAGYMIKNKQLLVVNSTEKENPLTGLNFQKLGIESVLAAPLLAQNGLIGVLALFNKREPDGFTTSDKRFLGIVGTQCAQVVEGARLYAQERKLIAIRGELEIARTIQQGFLPKTNLMPDFNACYGVNIPAKEIGGDFFDIVPYGPDEFFISIGDVVGKGVPAALLMANTQAVLRSQLRSSHHNDFSLLAGNLNHLVCEFTSPGQFITGLFGSFNNTKREFKFVSAGHPIPFVATSGRLVPQTFESDIVFGVMPDIQFCQHTMSLPENSTMLLYTDGISEAENERGEQFGEKRTAELLCSVSALSAREICEKFVKTISEFSGSTPQSDDLTVVVAKC